MKFLFRSVSIAAALSLTVGVVAVSASPKAKESRAVSRGASWLVGQVQPNGSVLGTAGVNFDVTAQTALALSGTTEARVAHAVAIYLSKHVQQYVNNSLNPASKSDNAANLAMLVKIAQSTKTQRQFHESTLIFKILQTQQSSGLFGVQDPTYNGTLRQGLIISALRGAGVKSNTPAMTKATNWLLAQQCPGGGFSEDAALDPCTGLASNFQGPDTNATALALVGLASVGLISSPAAKHAITWLRSQETAQAGWGFYSGNTTDSNSTAIVAGALHAMGASPASSAFAKGGATPITCIERYQTASGAFVYQAGSSPDIISTYEAVRALSMIQK
jgi:prenyltransferase beta subunit